MTQNVKISKSSPLTKIQFFLATGFYSGYSPLAPGTVGSFIILSVLWFLPALNFIISLLCLSLIFFIGVWSSSKVAQKIGEDPSIVVIDEQAGMWIPLLISPKSFSGYFIAFLLFRFFDIVKPFPIKTSEKLPNGWGIMMDDMIAGVYSLIIIGLLIFTGLL